MPSNVSRFEQLMYASIALGVIVAVIDHPRLVSMSGAAFVFIVQAAVFGFLVLMIWLTARRRKNWARWVLLILFAVGIPIAALNLGALFRVNLIAGLLSALQIVLQLVAFYLAFTGNARDWFRRDRPAAPTDLKPESVA